MVIAVLDDVRELLCPVSLRRLYQAYLASAIASHYRHELGNTLGAISSSAFFLRKRLKREPVFTEDARVETSLTLIETRIKEAAAKLGEDLVMPEVKAPRELVISDVAERLIARLDLSSSARVLVTEPSPLRVHGSEDELELLLFCLIENAIDSIAMKGAGEVRVTVGLGGERFFEVDDDGLGIPPEIGGAAQRAFVTSRPGHLGLGLCVARQLADRFHGEIELHPSDRGGVRARVALRANEE